MVWMTGRKKVRALKEAVARDDLAAVRGMLVPGFPISCAVGGESCVLRQALRNENVSMLSTLLTAGARPTPESGPYMALWVERALRRVRDGYPNAKQGCLRARVALSMLSRHGVDWDTTLPSLGSGDTARFVIEHAWPGSIGKGA